MPARLFVVHGSHPCATVQRALELKGIPYRLVELPASSQPLVMTPLFGRRTVPGIRFEDGVKVQGSRAILRELERRAPEPALFGAPEIGEAERWGDEVLQPVPRRLLWTAFAADPAAMHGFQEGQRSPKLPMAVVKAAAKVILPVERRMNGVTDEAVRADLAALPGMLDTVDAWIAAGVLGGAAPNAADLQIGASLRLLATMQDLRPLLAAHPAGALAARWFAPLPGTVAAGALPAAWLPPQPAAVA
ncbi:glutathione S-transferase [Baekduia soli]|uniref:Glutathione S-transferase n=1 Tax=Baekduia soli TaxID=496014 RepID=A0A5B8UAM5_9ACTN|nr:glutathione S-transferase family protein [Baekduia soli]QEC50120.1 glutathione S-transferase [Baekduia soli]